MTDSALPETAGPVVITDDDPAQVHLIAHHVKRLGYETETFESGEDLLERMSSGLTAGCIILDLKMPGIGGEETLKRLNKIDPDVPVIIASAQEKVDVAVRVMRLGAFDYIVKPIQASELEILLRNAMERRRMSLELSRLRKQVRRAGAFDRMIGRSAAMKNVFSLLEKTLRNDITVLILGQSGTGKELVARAIHQFGLRAMKPFVVVNCAAIPKELVESELFGHEKGSFTGAINRKIGKFEQADGGTLFLDEIGELAMPVQAKLLRALQEREIERVGGTRPIAVDVRVVTATKRNLADMVEEGRFREDLYYRINAFTIDLPPLKERREDIPVLVNHFIDKHREALGRPRLTGIAPEALRRLVQFDWPGNVRQLENVIARALVITDNDRLEVGDLPKEIAGVAVSDEMSLPDDGTEIPISELVITARDRALVPQFDSPDDIVPLDDVKEAVFRRAWEVCEGNSTLAAEKLGIGRATAFRFVDQFGLKREADAE